MTARLHIDSAQRRARLGLRHRLASGAAVGSVAEAASAMVVLHATDPASTFLQARARMAVSTPATIEAELHQSRTVLKLLAMRRTLFLVALKDVPMVHAAASRAIGEAERLRTERLFAGAGVAGGSVDAAAAHLRDLEAIGLAAVRARGEASTAELTALDPRLGEKITMAAGKSYEGTISVSQKVFFHLALDGLIGRGRPRGSWIAGQHRWSPIERWLPGGIAPMPVAEARTALVRRWLATFGPGTRDDLRWWTGWTVAAVKAALVGAAAVEVMLDGGVAGYVLPDDLEPLVVPAPWIALLPALDATTMGWQGREWYLGAHRPALFDRNGNAGPTIWVDGRVVGGWAHRRSGEVVVRLLEDVGGETTDRILGEAAALQAWLGPTRVSASFPTPLELELRG